MSNWDWKVRGGMPTRYEYHKVVLFKWEQYDGEEPPINAIDFVDWLNEKIQTAPAEYRDSVGIEIGSTGGYEGSTYATMEISYLRPETDDELNARIADYEQALRQKDEHEKAEFERLKQRFAP